MKKIFATLAFTLCLTAMVSCGEDKQTDNNTINKTEQRSSSISNATIKNKAESIVRRSIKATKNDHYSELNRIVQEEKDFLNKLTQEQIRYYRQCALEYGNKMNNNY
jgi:hypothetical protein